MNSVSLPHNRTKQLLTLGGGTLLTSASIFMVLVAESVFVLLGGVVGTLLFGYFTLRGIPHLKRKEPALIIDETGITDHTMALGVGHIPWSEVLGAELHKHYGQFLLELDVVDYRRLLLRVPLGKRLVARLNPLLSYNPITLVLSTVDVAAEELLELVEAHLEDRPWVARHNEAL